MDHKTTITVASGALTLSAEGIPVERVMEVARHLLNTTRGLRRAGYVELDAPLESVHSAPLETPEETFEEDGTTPPEAKRRRVAGFTRD